MNGDSEHKEHFANSFPTLPGIDRTESPNKKMRNMKNLSVNTTAASRQNSQLPKLGLSNHSNAPHAFSAPPTPAFIVPPKVPRKKPSNLGLTITTPEAVSNGQPHTERNNPPIQNHSEHQIRTLRALQTSTNGSLFSPTVAPEGGMRLPPFSSAAPPSRCSKARPPLSVPPNNTFDSTSSSPITRQVLDHVQEEADYEVPLSQEQKSPAYPQGPVCIYDPHVYLYLEPSHLEAREFDVILNVAREVKNPFTVAEGKETLALGDPGIKETHCAGRDAIMGPLPETPEYLLNASSEEQAAGDTRESTPSTPKATRPSPEYVHVPWDHNTNVVDDLLRLCELIDDRVHQGKRVLIHCQCGVSRSASLVVAFGLYKNPQLTVQEAYDAVKNKSRWIGPNMNLIYQLSEFKTRLPKTQMTGTSAWHSWRNNICAGRSDPNATLTPGTQSRRTSSTPRNIPEKSLSAPSGFGRSSSNAEHQPISRPGSARLPTSVGDVTPGPASAPPNVQFTPGQLSADDVAIGKPLDGGIPNPPSLANSAVDVVMSPSSLFPANDDQVKAPSTRVEEFLQEAAKPSDINENRADHLRTLPATNYNTNNVEMHNAVDTKALDNELDEPVSPRTIKPLVLPGLSQNISPSTTTDDTPIIVEKAPSANLHNPSPTLPAGFSSLFSRRQGPLRQLPIRQDPPRLISVPMPQNVVDPDVPPTPSLLSPRAAEFTASPFHRTAAGDLAGSSVFEQSLMGPRAQGEDPRSPVQTGEAPITRSIFDMI